MEFFTSTPFSKEDIKGKLVFLNDFLSLPNANLELVHSSPLTETYVLSPSGLILRKNESSNSIKIMTFLSKLDVSTDLFVGYDLRNPAASCFDIFYSTFSVIYSPDKRISHISSNITISYPEWLNLFVKTQLYQIEQKKSLREKVLSID